jgi:transposase InsO family protein
MTLDERVAVGVDRHRVPAMSLANPPQTNGICVRFHKTILQEFYQIAFRRKIYRSIEELQIDLNDWLHHYNHDPTVRARSVAGKALCKL